jgi:hypothetical protein
MNKIALFIRHSMQSVHFLFLHDYLNISSLLFLKSPRKYSDNFIKKKAIHFNNLFITLLFPQIICFSSYCSFLSYYSFIFYFLSIFLSNVENLDIFPFY